MSLPTMGQQADMPIESGPYDASWESLSSWTCPQWFEDAKFGIWAHWGPQCEAEDGDWYARFMYYPNTQQWNWHTTHFGSPATNGLKDLIHAWKAERWTPDSLIKLYKSAGAQYFMTLGNHHDNFDLWNSPYQQWNSVNMGPQRDIVGEWSQACKKYGLPMGISIHASHAWTWLEPSQPYDGNLTKEDGYALNSDGTEKWWKGYDPQELYAQRHPHSTGWDNSGTIHSQWGWGNGASTPSREYMLKLQNRVLQVVRDYDPKMLYFDDTVFPFYGVTDSIGLNILADFYNHSAKMNNGEQQVVAMGKILSDDQKKTLMWDVERGIPDRPQERHWQTCTCIGDWHYNQNTYNNNGYKSAEQVIRMLVDIVSKNGNLLLSVPIKGDGTIDDKELKVVNGIKAWMDGNKQSIYGTRPWKTFGEGPLAEAVNPMTAQGFNENNNYSSKDVRYVERHDTVFATIMAWPTAGEYAMRSFAVTSPYYNGKVSKVELLGYGDVGFRQESDALYIDVPGTRPNAIAPVFQLTFEPGLTTWQRLQELIGVLDDKVTALAPVVNYNTGKYSALQLKALQDAIAEAKAVGETAREEDQTAAVNLLTTAYQSLKTNTNKGGTADMKGATDVTTTYLKEAGAFERVDNSTSRFSTPKNWTVENFKIPQGGSDGTKNGIDRYPGYNCLMLGIWNDRQNNQEGDIANARIYQTVTLPKGKYYFGGAFETHYNIANGYIFAASATETTATLPDSSIAFYPISQAADGTEAYGVYFTLDKEQQVRLGFQADLSAGSSTQEFRVRSVRLLKYADLTLADIEQEIDAATLLADGALISRNTGYYSQEAVDKLRAEIGNARKIDGQSDYNRLYDAYAALQAAVETFEQKGKNPGGEGNEPNTTNLTTLQLVEGNNFTPVDGTDATKRFAAPKHWTVENFNIPQTDGSGTKAGLDKFTGSYALMMGLWYDRSRNTSGSLADARIYRKVSLAKGSYYFGAAFDNTWMPVKGYIFASEQLVGTGEMEQNTIAYYDMGKCTVDGKYNGIYFTLDHDADVYVGFQCDLLQGNETQEFRAKDVKLIQLPTTVTAITAAATLGRDEVNDGFYSISGITLPEAPSKGWYIHKSGRRSKVIYKK